MDPRQPIAGIGDSKTLSASRRERLAAEIIEHAAGWALGEATVEEIDEFNILGATLLAMKRAVAALTPVPELVLVDGPHCPPLKCATRGIIKGDASITSIGAASILAKVNRDAQMVDLARHYPGYGFERHKGYPTREHLRALAHQGVSPQHRRSFRPVKQYLETLGTQR
jgi:ribonuclease HII